MRSNNSNHMQRKLNRRLAVLAILIPVLIAALVYGFVYHVNHFELSMTLHGNSEVTLEYGEKFIDPGASAVFHGNLILKDGIDVPVTVHSNLNQNRLGTYEITYRARHERWMREVVRIVHIVDTSAPRIMLVGDPRAYVLPGAEYQEEGFMARDNYDGAITDQVVKTQYHDRIIYSVTDSSGNRAEVTRKIVYFDPTPPVLELKGSSKITITVGDSYREPGYSATDNGNVDLTNRVEISGSVNTYRAGTYKITYRVQDDYGNETVATRTVTVKAKPQPQTSTPSGKVIYLTFDDGPGAYTSKLLKVLRKYNVKATFFVTNTGYVHLIADIVADGHAIGMHSTNHNYKKIYASENAFFEDNAKMQDIIEKYSGVKSTLLRFPGGSSNTVSKFNPGIMSKLTKSVQDMGFQYFDWNVDSNDAGGAKTADKVFENVISGVKNRSVSVVLQHDVKGYSVDAVERIIIWGLENGYTFLPLKSSSPAAHHGVNN